MTRSIIAATAVLMLGVVAACTTDQAPPSGGGDCSQERAAGEPGDAEPLLAFGSLAANPLVVYADGAVAIPQQEPSNPAGRTDRGVALLGPVPQLRPGYYADQPGGYTGGWLTPCQLRDVEAAAAALFTGDVDFGSPLVDDASFEAFTYFGGAAPVGVGLQAFDRTDPGQHLDLSSEQLQARTDLADLWNGVTENVTSTEALEIDRLTVTIYMDGSSADLPLPSLVEAVDGGCGVIDDPDDVADVLDLIESNGGSLLGDDGIGAAATATPPGVEPCA